MTVDSSQNQLATNIVATLPSNVHTFDAAGSEADLVRAAVIIAAELSTPWILPVPFARVCAILTFITPSGSG